MRNKKKKVEFNVRPRPAKEELPADPEQWVRVGEGVDARQEMEPKAKRDKRLTLNLPTVLHTAFKGRCVLEGVTIQDKVRALIERELASDRPPASAGSGSI